MVLEYRVWFTSSPELNIFPLVGRGREVPRESLRKYFVFLGNSPGFEIISSSENFQEENKSSPRCLLSVRKRTTATAGSSGGSEGEDWKSLFFDFLKGDNPQGCSLQEDFQAVMKTLKVGEYEKIPYQMIVKAKISESGIEQSITTVISPTGEILGIYQSITIKGATTIASHLMTYFASKSPCLVGSIVDLITALREKKLPPSFEKPQERVFEKPIPLQTCGPKRPVNRVVKCPPIKIPDRIPEASPRYSEDFPSLAEALNFGKSSSKFRSRESNVSRLD